MHRLVNLLAMMAAVLTLGAGLWQDWGLLATMKKMFLSYLGMFFVAALLTLAVVLVPMFEKQPTEDLENKKKKAVKA